MKAMSESHNDIIKTVWINVVDMLAYIQLHLYQFNFSFSANKDTLLAYDPVNHCNT